MPEKDHEKILSSRQDIVNQKSLNPLDLKYETSYGINLLILSILYDIDVLFNRFLSERVYSPDELRQIKNSDGYNLMAICRNFGKLQYMEKIKEYIQKY